jgi:PAS domain S-box-containing protein
VPQRDRDRIDGTARAIIECAADAIIAFGPDRRVSVWNPAAEQLFGWRAAEVVGLEPPFIPEELRAEHNAVLERVASGGQVSFATRRICRDGTMVDVRIDASRLLDSAGAVIGWVCVCHKNVDDQAVRHYMAERARVVRRLGDVVADMNAQLDLEAVLDRIAASLRELTRADAGGFVLIEKDKLRLVSLDGLPAELRGRTADLTTSMVGQLMRSGKSVLMATSDSGGFDDLIWAALPRLHTITLSLSHVAGRPYGALYALYSGRKVGHIELELLELLAGHASVALSNATAFGEVVRQRAHERAVIDASADGIAVLDSDGLVRQWNPAAHRLTGLSPEVATGRRPPFPLPEPGSKLTYKLANGRWIDLLCTGLSGRDEKVLDFRDITAAKELEEAKDLFLATTSHELRTPITVVQGFASTLASRWDKLADADRRSAVQTIAERAGSLARLPSAPCRICTRSTSTCSLTCRKRTGTRWPPTSSLASCWRTRSSTRRKAARSPFRRGPTAPASSSPFGTRVSASGRRTGSGYSIASFRARQAIGAVSAALASVSTLSGNWRRRRAARSPSPTVMGLAPSCG